MSASSVAEWAQHVLSGTIGFLALFAIFVVVGVSETFACARPASKLTARRWLGNLSLYALIVVIPLLPGIGGARAAVLLLVPRYDLLDRLSPPAWMHLIVGILLLDLISYASHRIFHSVGFLWRLHAVHHSDPEVDVSTSLRHHPVEGLVLGLVNGSIIALLGVSPLAVAIFAWLAIAVQLLAHGNLAIPARLGIVLRRIVITPDFHRLHHSRARHETDSNYGTVFPFWDILLGTARDRSPDERNNLEFGLDAFRSVKSQQPHWMLLQPVLAQVG